MPEDKNKKKQSSKDSKSLAREAISTSDKKKVQAYKDSLNLYNYSILQAKNYFKEPNPNKYSDYNKKEAIDRMRIDKGLYGSLSNSMDDKYGSKITNLQKRTGYLPIGQRYIGEGSNYIFKKPVQPYVLEKEKPTITPVKQEIVKQDLTPTGTVKLPTDSDISIKVEKRGGKFAVDYFDVDEKSNLVPKTEIFDTADEADSFVKIRKDEGKFYGPSMTRRGVDSDVAKKIASKSSYGQYRKLGTGKEK